MSSCAWSSGRSSARFWPVVRVDRFDSGGRGECLGGGGEGWTGALAAAVQFGVGGSLHPLESQMVAAETGDAAAAAECNAADPTTATADSGGGGWMCSGVVRRMANRESRSVVAKTERRGS